ncbi:hypothetical protein LTR49_028058 [Elasticomyces elasticus]|nr:hypothetical protein LTR49_028058 [Elasticomyces elasticus]
MPSHQPPPAEQHSTQQHTYTLADGDRFILFGDSILQQSFSPHLTFPFGPALSDVYTRKFDISNRDFSGYYKLQAFRALSLCLPEPNKANMRILLIMFGANDARLHQYPRRPGPARPFRRLYVQYPTHGLPSLPHSPRECEDHPRHPSSQLQSSPLLQFACGSSFLYIIAILYLRTTSFRDPAPGSSMLQAHTTIGTPLSEANRPSNVCVGIPSIARKGARYLRLAVGSLLEGLAQEERDRIHLAALIAHTDPMLHPAYHEPWLANLVDDVLVYDLPPDELKHITDLEKNRAYYATGAEHVIKFEDHVLAMDGWFHRTTADLKQAARQSASKKAYGDYLYLRLFYTEAYLGYNSEDLVVHVLASFFCVGSITAFLLYIRSRFPKTRWSLTTPVICAASAVVAPAVILLFFAAGRVTFFPLADGVKLMNNYGCCAQGQAFPRYKISALDEYLERARIGFIDTLTEAYADEHNELRWAMTPSVIQHIGSKSSKDGDDSHVLWSFPFENYDPVKLREEHQAMIESGA